MKKEWKIIPNLYNALISHKYPVALIQFVTQRCNAKCPHCFVNFKTEKDELRLDEIEKITSSTGSCLRNISLTGGEPFIRDDLFEIADIWNTNSSAQSIVLTTNGSLPDRIENFCYKAAKKEMPVSFFISYDFIGEEHSKYRGLKNLHENVLESCKIIKSFKNKFNTTLQITVTPDTADTAIKTYHYMKDMLQAQNINCTLFRGERAEKLNSIDKKRIIDVYKKIQTERDNDFENNYIKGITGDILTSTLINAKNKILWKYVEKIFRTQKYISPCSAGSLIGVIYHDGSIFPCERRNQEVGKLKDFNYNFIECWHSEKAKQIQKEIISSKCNCTNECFLLINILSSPRYYGELSYQILRNLVRKNG